MGKFKSSNSSVLEKVIVVVGLLVTLVGMSVGLALLLAWFVELLWNDLMPRLFKLTEIGFWDAFKLSLLCSLLFKSTGVSSSKSE